TTDRGAARGCGGRHSRRAQCDRRAVHGSEGGGLHRGRGPGDARAPGDRPARAEAAHLLRGEPARVDLPRPGGAGARVPARPFLRRAGGREGDGLRRAAAPGAPHLRGRGRGHGCGPRHRKDPRGRGGAVRYEGKDRRRPETSPLRARRRLVTPEVLRQVKGIELRTRSLVSSLFTGEYRSMFADKVELIVRPAKGRPHALRVIRDLVAFTPRGRGTNLGEALSYAAKLPRHHAIVVVLSDFRAEGWEVPLAQLAARHDVVAITIDDPRERHLPDAGWVDMEDAETGHRVLLDTSHAPTRTRVSVAAERQFQERTRKLVQAGVDRVALQTNVPY